MNLILLDGPQAEGEFPKGDRRYAHIRFVLRSQRGACLRAGVVEGPLGRLEIVEVSEEGVRYRFYPEGDPPPPAPVEVILGALRPITARRILKDLTALGVRKVTLVRGELTEGSYLESSLWKKGEFERCLREGAEQGETTHLPRVELYHRLERCLAQVAPNGINLVLTPDAAASLGELLYRQKALGQGETVRLAVGPERGWTDKELEKFQSAGFLPCRLGKRVLRSEAAVLIAVGMATSVLETADR